MTSPRQPADELAARTGWRRRAEFVLGSLRPPQRPALYLINLKPQANALSGVPDTILAAVETLLHRACRRSGTALRLAHGQFLLLDTVSAPHDARATADQLTAVLTRPLPSAGPWASPDPFTLTVSIGVAVGLAVRPDLTALFWTADAALYRATPDGTVEIEILE